MYICVCNAITEKDVHDAERSGAVTHDDVFKHFGTAPQCGCCIDSLCDRLNCCSGAHSANRAAA